MTSGFISRGLFPFFISFLVSGEEEEEEAVEVVLVISEERERKKKESRSSPEIEFPDVTNTKTLNYLERKKERTKQVFFFAQSS